MLALLGRAAVPWDIMPASNPSDRTLSEGRNVGTDKRRAGRAWYGNGGGLCFTSVPVHVPVPASDLVSSSATVSGAPTPVPASVL